ncbi:hypothetical protein [Methylocystis echinoides]|uniref:hypothetical protein n=1 Tax=Methylocystis echinoides TaxID=29468 RepID=UPI003420AF9E
MDEAAALAFLASAHEAAEPQRDTTASDEPRKIADAAPATAEEADAKKTIEIRITLGPNDSALQKILAALEPQHRFPAPALPNKLDLAAPARDDALAPAPRVERRRPRRSLISPLALLAVLAIGFALRAHLKDIHFSITPPQEAGWMKGLINQIVSVESHGEAVAKNAYSSAMGVGQFVEATWLGLIKKHRPDIASSLNEKQILELRKDPELSRFMAGRYAEENTSLLARRGLPVTPGSLYLAHFAGPAGAAAILTAPEGADAASVIANVDARPGITREKIVTGNPFMKSFTARDLKNWAEVKMQGLAFAPVAHDEKGEAKRD